MMPEVVAGCVLDERTKAELLAAGVDRDKVDALIGRLTSNAALVLIDQQKEINRLRARVAELETR
jgi:hypothetical protein